jgi:hypothetical protein
MAAALLFIALTFSVGASSMLPISTLEHVKRSDAVFRGEVLQLKSFLNTNDGHIYTTAFIRVDQTFKGVLPSIVKLTHRGGAVVGLGEIDGSFPMLKTGETRLFFAAVRPDGTAFLLRGDAGSFLIPAPTGGVSTAQTAAGEQMLSYLQSLSADSFDGGGNLLSQGASAQSLTPPPPSPPPSGPNVSVTNLLFDASGPAARFTPPDRGEPIPYLVDADYLPAGITTNQALQAVSNALAAWSAVTSVKYTFLGLQSFGQASFNVTNLDGVLRIQLHDHYNYIGGGNGAGDILGQGGQTYYNTVLPGTSWTTGGNVRGSDFYLTAKASIVLSHTSSFMTNITNFAEVLCHEIGHTLGMAHSSQNPSEPNPYLSGATMYYAAHGNGRGATLGAYDPPVIQQVHPQSNLPPFMYPRLMRMVTSSAHITNASVNTIQLRGYSMETKTLGIQTNNATANAGSFSLSNSFLHLEPNGYYSDNVIADPSTGYFFDEIFTRIYDGTNASPYQPVRSVAIYQDSYTEGIPDSWRTAYFGNSNPGAGVNHHATDDADGDGYSNLTEFQIGSNPTNKLSNLMITNATAKSFHWQATPYEVYEILGSSNLITWQRATNPLVATNSDGVLNINLGGLPKQFYRVERVP